MHQKQIKLKASSVKFKIKTFAHFLGELILSEIRCDTTYKNRTGNIALKTLKKIVKIVEENLQVWKFGDIKFVLDDQGPNMK